MQNDNIAELINIHKSYGSTQVLKGIDLTIKQGDFISIRGKSGAGKTNLFKIVGLL
jgi:ABC-type histidine transport system ATPase subunit